MRPALLALTFAGVVLGCNHPAPTTSDAEDLREMYRLQDQMEEAVKKNDQAEIKRLRDKSLDLYEKVERKHPSP